eukprot:TRINITY_DN30923_c0_g1_i1.p1 TRINITY_DN30923_c0_g1~~TRINITY_DN30923_c0_g1_i1.p1  ORF type:complete len:128 (-),score=30.86 TRINITY_DN30923_c0_g1_i1:289-633(-)
MAFSVQRVTFAALFVAIFQHAIGNEAITKAEEVVSEMDTDEDMQLSLAEIKAALDPEATELGDREGGVLEGGYHWLEESFRESDENGDGFLSVFEFMGFKVLFEEKALQNRDEL